jgi:hypothetical protein
MVLPHTWRRGDLVVDDDAGLRLALRRVLVSQGSKWRLSSGQFATLRSQVAVGVER